LQGNQGISLAGNEAIDFNVTTTDQGVVDAAAAVTMRALDVLEKNTSANFDKAVSAASRARPATVRATPIAA